MSDVGAGLRYSATDLALALGLPHAPTREQAAIIEAPLESMLVIAGAVSGKTETMAGRVVWLVANGRVRRDEVLGLTFTRKAAGELGTRIRERIAELDAKFPGVTTILQTWFTSYKGYGKDGKLMLSSTGFKDRASAIKLIGDAILDYEMSVVTEADKRPLDPKGNPYLYRSPLAKNIGE